jgi:hypothetical protein
MSLSSFFSFKGVTVSEGELPEIYPMDINQDEYIKSNCFNIFSKILIDTLERTFGIKEDLQKYLWDNCLANEGREGLVSMLARAITNQGDLFIVFDPALGVIRRANASEMTLIKSDYDREGKSSIGVYVSFRNYSKINMLKFYSAVEYCTVAGLNKQMNLSKAVQIKLKDLRGAVALNDKDDVINQAKTIAKSLADGKDIAIDSNDMVETTAPDLTPVKESINFINQKMSFYLGLPESYVTGALAGGLGDTGQGDTKAIDRGLKGYYFSIIKPVLESVFQISVSYKTQDFSQLSTAIQALQTFELIDDTYISSDNKKLIINKLLDIEEK